MALLAQLALWRYALRDDLIRSDRNSEDMRLLTRRLTPSLGFYLVVILIGFFFPTAAVFGYLLIAIGLLVPTGIRPPVSKTTAAS